MPDPEQPTLFEAVQFSQANKLCFRATPEQSAWLASHMASTGKSISALLRDAIDLYITSNQPTGPP